MEKYQIDKITTMTLHCRDGNDEEFAIICDIEPDSMVSMSISSKMTYPPVLNVAARVSAMTVNTYESEMDDSSEELDSFLKQFLKE